MIMHRGFVNLGTAVTTGDDILSQVEEAERPTIQDFYICAQDVHQFPRKEIFFISRICDKTKRSMKEN